ncbi:class I SAM-dependent methyltransferase [Adhaeretor mobilis]|uniref:Ubiquinone/menaquinone biosynthesis C-methyltransferase UbiE n=1 Tax=Adhaeretor mobilis TaxID=1930276 RepID=A0A517MRQ0_9BACT|nr:methyltransferase domain-containing protein [Adhaeretor mobilis]QDS97554.1 Ubiquinone/menaquinone biosynthesis C-methyltransferase UbiE [Adhaeretor mobilis]
MVAYQLSLRFALAIALLTVLASKGSCQAVATPEKPTSVKPGINDSFLDPNLDVDDWVARFEVESREIFRARDKIVTLLKLTAGDVVADIGAGTGLFVEPFARAVGPTGQVLAIDIAPAFVERVSEIAKTKKLPNVTPVLGGEDNVRLPPESIDVAFICDTYHHFENPQASLASIQRALKHGGQLVVIDFERIPGVSREWTLGHVRAGKGTFRREIEQAGFEFVEEALFEELEENYFLRFRKP